MSGYRGYGVNCVLQGGKAKAHHCTGLHIWQEITWGRSGRRLIVGRLVVAHLLLRLRM